MVSIHRSATDRVACKLSEQASAHTEIAATLLLKFTDEAAEFAAEHSETAALFRLLHTECVSNGLLDRLKAAATAGAAR